MKVAVLCEFSGIVRDAFIKRGHEAISCDVLDTDSHGPHIKGDCRDYDWSGYDLIIAHPPCTHLSVSGARWFKDKKKEQQDALEFFRWCMDLPALRVCVENPISIVSSKICKPTQIIQPWQFGHGETKATCFWLKYLPPLKPTKIVEGRENKVHLMPPSKDRGKLRSITYQGIADAMARQWG
jgi:site-specific DNA-cytosine methylase